MIFIKWLFNRKKQKENLFEGQLQKKSKENTKIDTFNSNDTSKSAKEIAERAYILFILHLVTTYQIESKDAFDYLSRFNIFFVLNEDDFKILNESSSVDHLSRSFKIENIHVLLWTLKRIDVLKDPTEVCNVKQIIDIFFPNGSLTNPNRFVYENKYKREAVEIENMIALYDDNSNEHHVKLGASMNQYVFSNRLDTLKWVLNKNTILDDNFNNIKYHEF